MITAAKRRARMLPTMSIPLERCMSLPSHLVAEEAAGLAAGAAARVAAVAGVMAATMAAG